MSAVELKSGVYWVGVKDWERKIFDSLIPLPLGTTYNSYLVKGSDKTALIDTVNPGFEKDLLNNIKSVHPGEIDYLVMNHAEPDHAGSIPAVLERYKKAAFITGKKGKEMAKLYFQVPEERIKTVNDGDTLDLGGKTLKFIEAPWLHWPETMFSYLIEDKVLFPCDFLGLHTAQALYDHETEDFMTLAQAYFGEIMMPFRKMGKKALEKIKDLEIDMIAPSHGPIHKDPKRILDAYKKWTAGETKQKAIVVYVSMWNSTETMVRTMVDTLVSEDIEVGTHDLTSADLGYIARDLVDSRAIVLGSPTVLGNLHPLAVYAAHLVKVLKPPLQYGVFLSSYGWGGGAKKQALEILGPTGLELLDAHEIKGPPSPEDLQKISETGKKLALKIKE